jgi:hypothetical protein
LKISKQLLEVQRLNAREKTISKTFWASLAGACSPICVLFGIKGWLVEQPRTKRRLPTSERYRGNQRF